MPAPGTPLGLPDRYRLEGPIATGGMATVYAAHDTVLDRPVAVKVLAEHLGQDAVARQRFEREARAAAALSAHPGVVTTFDVGEHDGRAFIVMERRMGGTVAERLASRRPVPREQALDWLRETAAALDAAHDRGIVHRDVKPANLLLDEHDRVAVADFGIARLAYETQVTQTGQVLGTAAYISPEQATGQSATAASDRYGLAVVAFELLTGSKPYSGEHFAAQARAHVEDPVPSASALAPELPTAVDRVLARGMAKEPSERYATGTALVDALRDALGVSGSAAIAGHHAGPSRSVLAALAAVAALLAIVAIVLADGGSNGTDNSSRRAERSATPTRTATRSPRKTPTETPSPSPSPSPTATTATATATATATTAPAGGDPSPLNAQGFKLIQAGRYQEAVAPLQGAVAACGDSTALDPCGFAIFNLGKALNRSGNPGDAIPLLQRRLAGWDNQTGVVQAELASACDAAGQDCGGDSGNGNGHGNGRTKAKPGKGPKG